MFKLEKCFPQHEVVTTQGVIYPQFWTKNIVEVETTFHSHMNALKAIFCVPHKLGGNGRIGLLALFSTHDLDLQSSHFMVTMMHNYEAILREENNLNLMIRLWCKITTNPILNHKLSKFMKLVEIVIVQVFNLVEDECTFNTISFMKNRLQKWLNIHLDLYIHSFSQ